MGVERCVKCNGKFEAYTSDGEDDFSDGDVPEHDTCPACRGKEREEAAKDDEASRLRAEVASLQAEVQVLRKQLADARPGQDSVAGQKKRVAEEVVDLTALSDDDPPASSKRAKHGAVAAAEDEEDEEDEEDAEDAEDEEEGKEVWVLAKGDHPENQYDELVLVSVLGAYSSRARAEQAKEAFLEDGEWQEGYGYHQGNAAESTIDIFPAFLNAAVEDE